MLRLMQVLNFFLEEVLMWLPFGRWQGWLSVLVFCPLLGSFLSGCEDI